VYVQELGVELIVMAVGREKVLHLYSEGKASKFAGFQAAKGTGIEEFIKLIRGGFVEADMGQNLPLKTSKPRDKLRRDCTTAVLVAISEYQCILDVLGTRC
jgi:hypothetical protein